MKKIRTVYLLVILMLFGMTGCGEKSLLSADDPVTLTMWHVYGEQADSPMNRLISEFNDTVGKEKGIIIDVTMVSNTSKIGNMLLESQADKPGAEEMPDLFFCHTNNADALGVENMVDWNACFTKEELSHFVEGFVLDGTIDGRLAVFPVSKSTYALYINGTQFARFSEGTGVTYEDLSTWDGFFDAAEKYYEWSGGKTFCALDYLIRHIELDVLAKEGRLYDDNGWYDLESGALKEAWMPFARALARGHIAVSDLYANTQIMTGETMTGIGSTAAILYFNDTVTYPDNTSEPTNLQVLPLPKTAGKPGLMPQTGVGLCAWQTTEQKAEAASVFAHWLTESQRNLEFVVHTGYMPVNNGAFAEIDAYTFPSEAYANLYHAIKVMCEEYSAVVRPTYDAFYDRVDILYDGLRERQGEYRLRSDSGEDAEAMAEEIWNFFCSIQ